CPSTAKQGDRWPRTLRDRRHRNRRRVPSTGARVPGLTRAQLPVLSYLPISSCLRGDVVVATRWNRVVTARVERVTTQHAPCGHVRANDDAMSLDGLYGVSTTGGMEPATRRRFQG